MASDDSFRDSPFRAYVDELARRGVGIEEL